MKTLTNIKAYTSTGTVRRAKYENVEWYEEIAEPLDRLPHNCKLLTIQNAPPKAIM